MLFKSIDGLLAFPSLVAGAPTAGCSYISAAEAARVKAAFADAKVTPNVVPAIDPKLEIFASYVTTKVDLGTRIPTLQTVSEPEFNFGAEPGYDPATTKYLKLIIDPDAPGPDGTVQNILTGVLSEFFHLAISDAQPEFIVNQSPKTIRMYLSPTPLSVAPHRYSFLVYRQPLNFTAPISLALTISSLNLQQFVAKNNLKLVGRNYFLQGLGTNLGGVGEGGSL